jgi:GT2 family glycosyltransferase
MTDLSIILVNWNCLDFTEQCIGSICATTHNVDYEVIVVDNASADAPCRGLVEKYPWMKLVLSEQNIGFGRANNLGVRHSTGRNLLFLNPDTLVLKDALLRMLTDLRARPKAGAIGCRLFNPDGTLQTTCVQPIPTIFNQIFALDWLQRRWPSLPLWGKQALYYNGPDTVHQVDAVSGAAILVRRVVFEEVGGFNPEYFMYAEEIDLCYAIRRAGWNVMHSSEAKVIHFGGQSSKKCEDGFDDVTMRDSICRFFRRTRGSSYAGLYRICLILSSICRLITVACVWPFAEMFKQPSERIYLTRVFRKWLKIARWGAGWENNIHRSTQARPSSATPAKY